MSSRLRVSQQQSNKNFEFCLFYLQQVSSWTHWWRQTPADFWCRRRRWSLPPPPPGTGRRGAAPSAPWRGCFHPPSCWHSNVSGSQCRCPHTKPVHRVNSHVHYKSLFYGWTNTLIRQDSSFRSNLIWWLNENSLKSCHSYPVLLDDAILHVSGWRLPGDADAGAVAELHGDASGRGAGGWQRWDSINRLNSVAVKQVLKKTPGFQVRFTKRMD